MNSHARTNAQRQADYRKRQRAVVDELFSMRGLPTLPAIATISSWPRWKEAMTRIAYQLEMVETEMTQYYDERSDRWQESDNAETFYERREMLRQIIESLQEWPN